MEQEIAPVHEAALADAMRLLVQFSKRTGLPVPELSEAANPKLATFARDITETIVTAANRMGPPQVLTPARERFNRRVEHALRDVETGFISNPC